MFQALRRIWARFAKSATEWKQANEESHRRQGHGNCCSAPMQVYTSRPQRGEGETKR